MKKTAKARKRVARTSNPTDDEFRAEYEFNYQKAKPNRFAAKFPLGSRVVVLDADVAKVFTTPESVNTVLRAIAQTIPSSHPTR